MTSSGPRRVAVTGLGVVSAIGVGREAFWEALAAGRSGVTPVESFRTGGYRSRLGAEVKGFSPKETYSYALAAAREALAEAGLERGGFEPARAGLILGTTFGECLSVERAMARLGPAASLEQVERESRAFFPGGIPARVARELGFGGPNLMLTTACAAGNFALAAALDKLRAGAADVILAGGVDLFSEITYAGFSRLLALAPDRCAPFSRGRQGLVPGEGCAVLALEPLEAARRRGARVYAELLGYGASSDAKHPTAPDQDGVARALRACLGAAGLSPADVGYVNAHGTGTPANDKTETAALKAVFGERVRSLPVSSIKSMLGHAMGAASALEAAACCLMLREGLIAPTINFTPGDPECDLDYVPGAARKAALSVVLSDAFAFGGSNCVVALAKPGRPDRPEPAPSPIAVTGVFTVERCADPAALAEKTLPELDLRFIDAPMAYALLAAKGALADARLSEPPQELGLVLDSSGELESQLRFYRDLASQGPQGVEPRLFPNILANAAAGRAAIAFGLKLLNESLAGSFPAGEAALAQACEFLGRRGAGALLAGAVWDAATMLVVEPLARARERGARIYAAVEVLEQSLAAQAPRPEPADCFCLARALAKVRAGGRELVYTGRGVWGGRIKLRLSPPARA